MVTQAYSMNRAIVSSGVSCLQVIVILQVVAILLTHYGYILHHTVSLEEQQPGQERR